MAKQINLDALQSTEQKIKNYIDSRATAQVVKTSVSLYEATDTSTPNTITLSQSLDDFDAVEVVTAGTSNIVIPYTIDMSDIVYGTTEVGFNLDSSYYVWYTFTNSTTMTKDYGEHKGYIKAVKGIKYSPKENYSTDEQIIGTWIDGKPLYQKTIDTGALPSTETSGLFQKNVSHNIQNIERVVDISGYARRPSTGLTMAFNHSLTQSGATRYVVAVANDINVSIISDANLSANYTESFVTIKYTKV